MQRELQQNLITQHRAAADGGKCIGHLLLLEHDPPVITISRRNGASEHLTASPRQLAEAGIELADTDRGGDITYHGPGQLVVYPILDLNRLGLRIAGYMRLLEQIVIDTLADFGIEGHRDPQAPGVWVKRRDVSAPDPKPQASSPMSQAAKICAMGVRVTRWISMHGLALNVTTNLDHFDLIVPCGLVGRGAASMRELLGENCPAMDEVKRAIVRQFEEAIADRFGEIRPVRQ